MRASTSFFLAKTWMAGTRPAMTGLCLLLLLRAGFRARAVDRAARAGVELLQAGNRRLELGVTVRADQVRLDRRRMLRGGGVFGRTRRGVGLRLAIELAWVLEGAAQLVLAQQQGAGDLLVLGRLDQHVGG